jgi:hypothetical protein
MRILRTQLCPPRSVVTITFKPPNAARLANAT